AGSAVLAAHLGTEPVHLAPDVIDHSRTPRLALPSGCCHPENPATTQIGHHSGRRHRTPAGEIESAGQQGGEVHRKYVAAPGDQQAATPVYWLCVSQPARRLRPAPFA